MKETIQKQTLGKAGWISPLTISFILLAASITTNARSLEETVIDESQTIASTNIPAIIANLPLHEWQAISLNTIRDVDPCPVSRCAWSANEGLSGVLNDWTGGVYASNEGELGGLVYFGGGHNGYYGNEVYFFDLATLLWERRGEPTDGQIPGDPNTFGLNSQCRFWDGKPLAIHSYETVFYDPLQNLFWLTKVSDVPSNPPGPPSGCNSTLPAAFSLDSNTWSDSGTSPARSKFSATAWDAKRNLLWMIDKAAAPKLHSFDPVLDVWQTHGNGFPLNIDLSAAIDPVQDLLVVVNFRGGAEQVVVVDLNSLDEDWFLANTTGDTSIENQSQLGFEWAPQLGGFIAWKDGLDLFLLTPPASDPRNNPWVWSRINATGVTPDTPRNGPYSKFQYVPELGIALVASDVEGSVFAIRLAATTNQVKLYDTFTLSFDRPDITGNKFSEFPQVTFSKGAKTFLVDGFYYGDESGTANGNIWKARFMPDEIGQWDYSWEFSGATGAGTFNVIAQNNNLIRGHVKANGRFLQTDDGGGFLYRGANWVTTRSLRVEENASPEFYMSDNDWVLYMDRYQQTNHNGSYISSLDRLVNNDRESYDLGWAKRIDFAVEEAASRGIYTFLGIFNTWSRNLTNPFSTETNSSNQILDPWNNNLMAEKQWYIRYITARYAGYYNVFWELGNKMEWGVNSGSSFANLANNFYIPWLRQYDPYDLPMTLSENIYQSTDIEIGGFHQGQTIALDETQPIIHTELDSINGATDVLWTASACKNPVNRVHYRRVIWKGFIEGGSGSSECTWPFDSDAESFETMDEFLLDLNILNIMEDHGRLATALSILNNDLPDLIPTATAVLGTSSSSFKMRAQGDEEYVAYFWGGLGTGATIDLNIPTGSDYTAQWFSPSTGELSDTQVVLAGDTITSPWMNEYDVLLRVFLEQNNITSVDLMVSSTQVNSGETVILNWDSSNTNSCEASGGWSGTRAVSGSETSNPITTTTNFILSCTGNTGSSSDSVTVSINNGNAVSLGSGTIITNALVYDENNGTDWSIQANLQTADTMYGDRAYSFTQIPANLIGQEWISTANDSKSFVGGNLVTFTLAQDAEVFILHRDDIANKPEWLSDWADNSSDVINSEPETYSVFSRSFNAGDQVSLGMNGSTSSGMYVVVARATTVDDLIFTNGFE